MVNDELPRAESRQKEVEDASVLTGAAEIACFLFGTSRRARSVYHLAEAQKLPVFRCGTRLHARVSTLSAWVEAQEALNSKGLRQGLRPAQSRERDAF